MSQIIDKDQTGMMMQENPDDIWGMIRDDDPDAMQNILAIDPEEAKRRQLIRQHRAWLQSIPHECPSPYRTSAGKQKT